MLPRIEARAIKGLHEFSTRNGSVLETASKLDREFPGAIALLPQGSTLYHYSNNLGRLLSSGHFDPTFSNNDGAFFFADAPIPGRTNCVVEIPSSLILVERSALSSGNIEWEEAARRGIDGRYFHDVGEPFVKVADDLYVNNIAIFSKSLPKLGSISPYHF